MKRILLAEDELLVRELAIEDLSEAGWEVVAARDGDEALSILRSDTDFDVLFTDIRMPGLLDGWQLAAQAKSMVPGIRVIFASGLSDSQQEIDASDRFLLKPYKLSVLLEALAEVMQQPKG
jgi:CheY-like chemotaxis protein